MSSPVILSNGGAKQTQNPEYVKPEARKGMQAMVKRLKLGD